MFFPVGEGDLLDGPIWSANFFLHIISTLAGQMIPSSANLSSRLSLVPHISIIKLIPLHRRESDDPVNDGLSV